MTLLPLLIMILVAGLVGLVRRRGASLPVLVALSALAVFALQPSLPIRGLDFWLPTATLALTVGMWLLTTPPAGRAWKKNWPSLAIILAVVLLLGVTRLFGLPAVLTASRPPQFTQVLIMLGAASLLLFLLARFTQAGKLALTTGTITLILVFLLLKIPALATLISSGLRTLNAQSTQLASPLDLRWLGFSYIAFRLIHTLRDRLSGRLPEVSLAEYVVYVLFFPALTAGPIDRIERFIGDLRRPAVLTAGQYGDAGQRLLLGLFKKFALADSLALIAMNGTNATQVQSSGWAWVLLYAYAFQIYFDFSGYTDIAIGMGRLMGIQLPENFKSPLLKPNLTQFWNNWHMTLTQWFRAYFFNPLTRFLRSGSKPLPIPLIILITQLATMLLIGLWHGVSWTFVLWGLWHGLGLFVHNRWSEWSKPRFAKCSAGLQKGLNGAGVVLTFNYVALGWVFFALPDPATSLHFFRVLFSFG